MNWKIPPIGTWGGASTLLAALTLLFAAAVQASAALATTAPGRAGGDELALVQAL